MVSLTLYSPLPQESLTSSSRQDQVLCLYRQGRPLSPLWKVRVFKVVRTARGMGLRALFQAFFWNRLLFKLARLRGLVGFMRIMVSLGYLLMVNKIGEI